MTHFSIDSFASVIDAEPCNETGYPEAAGICTLVTGVDKDGGRVQAVFDAPDISAIAPGQKAFLIIKNS